MSETLLSAIYRHMWVASSESVAVLWQCMCCVPGAVIGCVRVGVGVAENT